MKNRIFLITVLAFAAATGSVPLCAQNATPSPTPAPASKENPAQAAAQIPLPEASPAPSQAKPANPAVSPNSGKPEAAPLIPHNLPEPAAPATPASPAAQATPPPSPEISYQKSETGKAVAQQKALIEFRQAEILAKNDSQVRADWSRAQNSKTFAGQRAALKDYYARLYALIAAKVPSLTAMSEARKTAALHRIELHFKPRLPQGSAAANSDQYRNPAANVRH